MSSISLCLEDLKRELCLDAMVGVSGEGASEDAAVAAPRSHISVYQDRDGQSLPLGYREVTPAVLASLPKVSLELALRC